MAKQGELRWVTLGIFLLSAVISTEGLATIEVEIPSWDVNHDGVVDPLDVTLVVNDLGKHGRELTTDADRNGLVDMGDFDLVASHFGEQAALWNPTANAIAAWLDQLAAQTPARLPLSFQILPKYRDSFWRHTVNEHERMVLKEGLVIYDGALAEILWALAGDFNAADRLTHVLWRGLLGELELRAYYLPKDSCHPFLYNNHPSDISADAVGKGGFIFKITNAYGRFRLQDPLTHQEINWSQWQPIAGENAWAGVIAPLQVYDQKYGSRSHLDAAELKLAKEIARAAMFLQAENGGIRMSPKGTWHARGPDWYYQEQSVENNLSWYAAFRMLYEITGEQKYKKAMERLEKFFKITFDPATDTFVQGMHFDQSRWDKNLIFATDVQTWAVLVLGPEWIDQQFGEGAAFQMLQATKKRAGVFDLQTGSLNGVDFTDYRDLGRDPMVSIEWTAGAVMAFQKAASYYAKKNPSAEILLTRDAHSMKESIKNLAVDVNGTIAYPYAAGFGPSATRPTGHGWFAPSQEVMSTASSVWMALLELEFNPFLLGGE